ncbi:hypothetical protein D9M69_310920 [compost metagenome]
MAVQPVTRGLACYRDSVQVPGGAQRGDEHLRLADLPRRLVDDRHGAPAEVDEQLVSRQMHLAHAELLLLQPGTVVTGELSIRHTIWLLLSELLPEQLQRHVGATELLMHLLPLWGGLTRACDGTTGLQATGKCSVVQVFQGGPGLSSQGELVAQSAHGVV